MIEERLFHNTHRYNTEKPLIKTHQSKTQLWGFVIGTKQYIDLQQDCHKSKPAKSRKSTLYIKTILKPSWLSPEDSSCVLLQIL